MSPALPGLPHLMLTTIPCCGSVVNLTLHVRNSRLQGDRSPRDMILQHQRWDLNLGSQAQCFGCSSFSIFLTFGQRGKHDRSAYSRKNTPIKIVHTPISIRSKDRSLFPACSGSAWAPLGWNGSFMHRPL